MTYIILYSSTWASRSQILQETSPFPAPAPAELSLLSMIAFQNYRWERLPRWQF